jgi:hypothetical protein
MPELSIAIELEGIDVIKWVVEYLTSCNIPDDM